MAESGKISVALGAEQLRLVRRVVEAGAYATPADVLREALRFWLAHRAEDTRSRSFGRAGRLVHDLEPAERVELLFDARDAKA